MTTNQTIATFTALGKRLLSLNNDDFSNLIQRAKSENPWFTTENIELAWQGIIKFLDEKSLTDWASDYDLTRIKPKKIALVMAGNIPLVGFHDFLCVLISGNSALIKASSKDSVLIHYLANQLIEIEPEFANRITFSERLADFDAVIATGSDNSSRYFEYYFGKYPHIIRNNRTSCAILNGDETDEDFKKLGTDIFSYFGLGCRNVSKVYVPEGYSFIPLLDSLEVFQQVINHHKYCNNYDYQKSIMLVNGVKFFDNGFLMLTESEKTVSPISVLYYENYQDSKSLSNNISAIESKLQCKVGNSPLANVAFGQTQSPGLKDYADRIDTLQFLTTLH